MKRFVYLILGFILVASSCSKDKSGGEPDIPEPSAGIILELSESDLVFESKGGEKTFTVTCVTDWSIDNESDWCTTDISAGTGSRTVTVHTESYRGFEDRNLNLIVKSGSKVAVLTVTQKYGNAIILDKAKFEVPQAGGNLSVNVKSNVTYEVGIPDFCSSWIALAPATRSEVSDTTYRFLIGGNEEDEFRTGYVVFSSGSLRDTVWIYQAQQDRLVLTQREFRLPAKDTTITVELRSNVEYEMTILRDVSSWLRALETRACRIDRLQFQIEGNCTGVSRTAKIVVRDKNGVLSDTLTIRQFDMDNLITEDFDPAFAKLLEEKGYISDASHITLADVKDIDLLDVSGEYDGWLEGEGLASLAGIEYFESLIKFDCSFNRLSSLDVSGCTALQEFSCDNNQLSALNVSGCTALQEFSCDNNRLSSLDVSECTALQEFSCDNNWLSSLDVSGYMALQKFSCDNNRLSSLDVSGCAALQEFSCGHNQLSSLNVSGCAALQEFSCGHNQLSSLDVSGCTALQEFSCDYNQLSSLNVSECTALQEFSCDYNQLSSLNVSECAGLQEFSCDNNQLSSLDVSGCSALTDLICGRNQLSALDVSGCPGLTYLSCDNNQLSALDVSGCPGLTNLYCEMNQLFSLDVSGCSGLAYLTCYNNQLPSLNISGCSGLAYLTCHNNQLSSLDISGCPGLTDLYCYENPGDGESLFPVTAWFDNDNIPGNIRFYDYTGWNGKSWTYGEKTIRIDFREAQK